MVRVVAILSLVLTHAGASLGQTWITVNSKVERIKKNSNCRKLSHGDEKAKCDCCLIKHGVVLRETPFEMIDACQRDYRCKFAKNSEVDKSIASSELKRAKQNLQSREIVDIGKLEYPPLLPSDGVLTNSHVQDILKKLQKEGHLSLPDDIFPKVDDETPRLLIKSLGDASKGVFSGQLFSIRFDPYFVEQSSEAGIKSQPLYILKETKKGVSEIEHLYRVSVSALKAEKATTSDSVLGLAEPTSPTIARISFDDVHFKIETDGKTRYFSLLQTAPGRSVHSYLKEIGAIAETKDIDDQEFFAAFRKVKKTLYRVGFAVSELHQKYARDRGRRCRNKTYVHGDMHSDNIFYDDVTGIVTLIDNETFVLPRNSGVNDILEFYMLHTVHTIAHKVARQLTTNQEFGISDDIWHELIRAMINGYLDAYGELSAVEFVRVFSSFKHEFMSGFSQKHFFESIHNMTDQRQLKRLGFSRRRHKIMHEELHKNFARILEDGIKKYERGGARNSLADQTAA